MRPTREERALFLAGYLRALITFAWYKDGHLYVGTAGKTWREARVEITAAFGVTQSELYKIEKRMPDVSVSRQTDSADRARVRTARGNDRRS